MDPDYWRLIAAVEDEHWWYVGRRRILATVLDGLGLSEESRLLDVGCGTGGNLPLLSRYGRLVAAETDSFARDEAMRRNVCEVHAGSLPDDLPFEGNRFDLVTALDVVEHIEDESAALSGLRDLLVEGGRLLLTVPAYQFLWSHHDVVNHHYRRYTRARLEGALRTAGFETLRLSYFNTWLFPGVAVVRLLERLHPRAGLDSQMRLPPPFVNRLLAGVFQSESRVLRHGSFPFGVSLLSVARNPG